jgi:phage N-6-adenine-methyltransferase
MNPFFTVPTIADKNKSVACMDNEHGLENEAARTSVSTADPSLSNHTFTECNMPESPTISGIRFSQACDAALPFHEYANLFPMMAGDALNALRSDIELHGVREPVVLLDGAILDGRNRYACAVELGIPFPTVEFEGVDALSFVISHNLHRRHLSEGQRASIAARVANMPRGGAIYRTANLQTDIQKTSQSDAASLLSVSERSVASARKVHETAPPEIVQALDAGNISVSLAEKVASLPDEAKADVIAAAPEQMREVAREAVKKAHVANNSGNNEWYTPAVFIEAARSVMGGFDLDPASSEIANRTVKADRIFTAEDDGLAQEWPVGRIWMNPPYAQPLMGQFADKFAAEVRRGSEGIVLVNNATETAWFQTIAAECSAICFPKSRIRFLDPDGAPSGSPLQGQAIFYCGPNSERFEEIFSALGGVFHSRRAAA